MASLPAAGSTVVVGRTPAPSLVGAEFDNSGFLVFILFSGDVYPSIGGLDLTATAPDAAQQVSLDVSYACVYYAQASASDILSLRLPTRYGPDQCL